MLIYWKEIGGWVQIFERLRGGLGRVITVEILQMGTGRKAGKMYNSKINRDIFAFFFSERFFSFGLSNFLTLR